MSPADKFPFQGLRILAPAGATDESKHRLDIVAVPGLGADPESSFESDTGDGFNWLTDEKTGILSFVPDARILRFHYDSRWRGAQAVPQTLSNAANSLLDALVQRRENDQKRPLIFLAHSMGGLVVAKCIAYAAAYPENLKRARVNECFAGAIFFGTPFRGSNEAAKAQLLQRLLTSSKTPPNQMIVILDPESDALAELRNSFTQIATKEPKPGIVCLYELKKTDYIAVSKTASSLLPFAHIKELVVTEQSAVLDFAEKTGMECDHRQLNRFDAKRKDGRYDVVRGHLSNIVKMARITVKKRLNASPQSIVGDVVFDRLIKVLDIAGFRSCRQKVETASGESQWIIADSRYRDWVAGTNESGARPCLWVSGNEGLGKAKTALSVVQSLELIEEQEPKTNDIVVAWFFCDSNETTQSAENLLKSLILQLIIKRRPLAQYVTGFVSQASSTGTSAAGPAISVDRLWSAIIKILNDPSTPEVFFVINGLHLLNSDSKSTALFLLTLQRDFIDKSDGNNLDIARSKAKWLILSRDRSNIKQVLLSNDERATTWINLADGTKSAELSEELNKYTRARVEALALKRNYSLALQFFVSSFLQQHAENNQLWVDIVCLLLEGISSDPVIVRKTIEDLPSDLDKLITQLWSRSLEHQAEGIDTIKEILRTLAIVKEDPTLSELKVLAEIVRKKGEEDDEGFDEEEDEDEAAEQILALVRSCGPLLRVYSPEEDDFAPIGWHKVAFIHPLAKAHLLENSESRKAIGLSNDGDLHGEVQWQHGVIALRCFSYTLDRLTLKQPSIDWNELTSDLRNSEQNTADKELDAIFPVDANATEEAQDVPQSPVLRYPVKYWLEHGHESTLDFVRALDLRHFFWHVHSEPRRRWWLNFARTAHLHGLEDLTSMHVASYFGLLPLVNDLLHSEHKAEINSFDSWDRQPLHWAAANGRIAVMDCLISAGAEINNTGRGKADQNGRLARGWTPLHMAASAGKTEAIKLLLDKSGVEINVVSAHVGTALNLAIASSQIPTAELLLERGASPVLAEADADSPVTMAVLGGHVALLAALLERGGAQNMTSTKYGTSFAAAASKGDPAIVEYLLHHDNNEESHERALIEAAASGHRATVRTILQRSPRINRDKAFIAAAGQGHESVLQEFWPRKAAKTPTRQAIDNALYEATCMEQEAVVEALLHTYHADPDATGSAFGNAITAAAVEGNQSILERLIESGANVNAPAGYALQAAASHGFYEIVTILLQAEASVNTESTAWPDCTPLQSACANDHYAIAELLLVHGANPDLGGGNYTFPIIAAVARGNSKLLRLLLQYHANPNVSGGKDRSIALVKAVVSLHSEDLEALIRANANVNNIARNGDTALIMSAIYDNVHCINILLKHHAHVNYCGKDGTALHVAARNGSDEICRKLLEAGARLDLRGGPYDTVVQAAAASGNKTTMKLILEAMDRQNSNLLEAEGGCFFTALHAASAQKDDGCLRLLLARKPRLDVVSHGASSRGTPLQVAIYARCNRNARLLLEAGANPKINADSRSDVLQAAAIRACPELVSHLVEHGADGKYRGGKYQNPLVAAVVRAFHEDDTAMLEEILEQSFDAAAYRQALNRAFWLKHRDAFKLLWSSARSPKKTMLNTKQLMSYYQAKTHSVRRQKEVEAEQQNSDFDDDGMDSDQDIGDEDDDLQQDDTSDADDDDSQTQPYGAEISSQTDQDGMDLMQQDQLGDEEDDSPIAQDPDSEDQTNQISGYQVAQDDEDEDPEDEPEEQDDGESHNYEEVVSGSLAASDDNNDMDAANGDNDLTIDADNVLNDTVQSADDNYGNNKHPVDENTDDDQSGSVGNRVNDKGGCDDYNRGGGDENVGDTNDRAISAGGNVDGNNSEDISGNDEGGNEMSIDNDTYNTASTSTYTYNTDDLSYGRGHGSGDNNIESSVVEGDDVGDVLPTLRPRRWIARRPVGGSLALAKHRSSQPTQPPQTLIDEAVIYGDGNDDTGDSHNKQSYGDSSATHIAAQYPGQTRGGELYDRREYSQQFDGQQYVQPWVDQSLSEELQAGEARALQHSRRSGDFPNANSISTLEVVTQDFLDATLGSADDGWQDYAQTYQTRRLSEEPPVSWRRPWFKKGKASSQSLDMSSTVTQALLETVTLDEVDHNRQASQNSNFPEESSAGRSRPWFKKPKASSRSIDITTTVAQALVNTVQLEEELENDGQASQTSNLPGEHSASKPHAKQRQRNGELSSSKNVNSTITATQTLLQSAQSAVGALDDDGQSSQTSSSSDNDAPQPGETGESREARAARRKKNLATGLKVLVAATKVAVAIAQVVT